jgi:uncharacterized MnhB-related membrane protein
VNHLKGLIIAAEAALLLVFGVADIVSGRLLGAAILLGIASLAAACAWALWPASPDHRPRWRKTS